MSELATVTIHNNTIYAKSKNYQAVMELHKGKSSILVADDRLPNGRMRSINRKIEYAIDSGYYVNYKGSPRKIEFFVVSPRHVAIRIGWKHHLRP